MSRAAALLALGDFSVDMEIVGKTIRNDLPKLAEQIRELLAESK